MLSVFHAQGQTLSSENGGESRLTCGCSPASQCGPALEQQDSASSRVPCGQHWFVVGDSTGGKCGSREMCVSSLCLSLTSRSLFCLIDTCCRITWEYKSDCGLGGIWGFGGERGK